jgi:hypothetical protein
MHSSFKIFLEFAGIIYKNCCTVNKNCTLTFLVALGMRSEGNAPKYGEPSVGFCFTTMFQHAGRFGQGFLTNNDVTKVNHPPYSPSLSPADFYLSSKWNQQWRNVTCVLLLTSWRMQWKIWKCFAKWLPGVFPTHLPSLTKGNSFTRGLLGRKFILSVYQK